MNEIHDIYSEWSFYGYRKIHAVQAYLLKDLVIDRPNLVWQVDITYIKIKTGFVYLVCLIDVYSRRIMGWNISVFLDTGSCEQALDNALFSGGKPEIVNSDQGCQFTSESWYNLLNQHGIKISMDGKGRWADNVYVERLWRTIKYELVYLHRFVTVAEARNAIADYIDFYNTQRPHQSLGYKVPDAVYKEFEYVKNVDPEVEVIVPVLGANYNSQIFCEKLS